MNSSISQPNTVRARTAPPGEPHPVLALADQACAVWPQNSARFRKAADLVAAGEVDVFTLNWQTGASGDPVGRAWSQADNGRFYLLRRVDLENDLAAPRIVERAVVSCECDDYRHGRAPMRHGQRFCKHVAAYRMAVRLQQDREKTMTWDEQRRAQQRRAEAKRRWQSQRMHARQRRYLQSTHAARRYVQLAHAGGAGTFAANSRGAEAARQVAAAEAAALAGSNDALVRQLNEELFG